MFHIIDLWPLQTVAAASKDLANVSVDIDDDIYWFTPDSAKNANKTKNTGLADLATDLQNSTLRVFEVYR
jgi:hypothetical protein